MWDPYGNIVHADRVEWLHDNRVGHKGLFFERLSGNVTSRAIVTPPTSGPRLGRAEPGFWHNRNRTYMPEYARFGQTDPNHMGAGIDPYMSFFGFAQSPHPSVATVEQLAAGNPNVHPYLENAPFTHVDPNGLFSLIGTMSTMRNMWNNAASSMNTAHEGNMLSQSYQALFNAYAINQLLDFEAIGDWDVRDEDLSFHASRTAQTREELFGVAQDAMNRSADSLMESIPGKEDLVAKAKERPIAFPDGPEHLKRTPVHGEGAHWPVLAERLHDNVYRIAAQPYNRRDELWQFEPGDSVVCEMVESADGPMLAAIRRMEP